MRRCLLLLLVALLPLRGWVGEAMAGEMLAQQMSAPVLIAPDQGGMPTGAGFVLKTTPVAGASHSDHGDHDDHAAHENHHGYGAEADAAPSMASDTVSAHSSAALSAAPCADHDATAHAGGLSPCATCASCQACSAVALQLTPTGVPVTGFTPPRPASAEARFASVLPTQGFKPPIS